MRKANVFLVAIAGAIVAAGALAHPAAEIYIPIGYSPGVSGHKSYIGAIESLSGAQRGITMRMKTGEKYLTLDDSTRVYLQYGAAGKKNRLGSYADCKAGLQSEVYVGEDGKARWIKIQMP
ncbi:MAG: hypothetical protein WAW79_10525 [Steroidobacteraceae bacterium]